MPTFGGTATPKEVGIATSEDAFQQPIRAVVVAPGSAGRCRGKSRAYAFGAGRRCVHWAGLRDEACGLGAKNGLVAGVGAELPHGG